ncbi:MtrAB system accessory lipoprotein LpqB [Rhodococcus tukisamuensis]|uniref:Lipoprotein LpqB n=1 Tax=Rhodococcus tukisamuensis TaxID=168276 RepID=A0A1G6YFW9_9NOCA|nr:MtrAB system accessory lipoprotein LpqB [Rhodococcus tukisamuensis]SDD89212.1 Sporulation and spore germination [Rhodococcus tukisamuensis]
MTGERRRGRGRISLTAALLAVAVVVGGCASLPESSSPQAIGTITREPVVVSVPVPTPGREPDLLLRDFFSASTDPADKHLAARQFLTPAASDRWDDTASTTVVDKVDVLPESRADDQATYTIRANRVGQLDDGGQYQAVEGNFEAKVRLSKVNGEWRIDDLPPGVIMDRPQFLKTYQRKALYFLDPSGTTVVPDLRWISATQEQMPGRLIELLIAGPKPALSDAVQNMAGKVSVLAPITKADGRSAGVGVGFGGLHIDFTGASALDQNARDLLAAQVVWTLAAAEISGPYVLTGDGAPLDERYANGWTTADVSSTNPMATTSTTVGLHGLVDGALVAVNDTGVSAMPGYFGTATTLESIALSRDGRLAAAVADTGKPEPEPRSALMVGPVEGFATPALEAGSMTRPTWSRTEPAVWTVVDGTSVVRVVRDPQGGQLVVLPVDTADLAPLGATITELRLSRDGVRAALIVDGKVYVATVVPRPDGGYALTAPRPVAIGLGSPALSLDWSSGEAIVVARAASDIPVVSVAVDGSRMDALPSRNLSAPVSSVDASVTTVFVADARAVFQLNNNDPAGDRYWREVPGLTGVKAIPILPG